MKNQYQGCSHVPFSSDEEANVRRNARGKSNAESCNQRHSFDTRTGEKSKSSQGPHQYQNI